MDNKKHVQYMKLDINDVVHNHICWCRFKCWLRAQGNLWQMVNRHIVHRRTLFASWPFLDDIEDDLYLPTKVAMLTP